MDTTPSADANADDCFRQSSSADVQSNPNKTNELRCATNIADTADAKKHASSETEVGTQ